MSPAIFGVLQALDTSGFQGYMDAAAVTARVPPGCRDMIINLDHPGPGIPDVTAYNARTFRDHGWRISYYHEIDPYVAPDIQLSIITSRINMVGVPWWRFVMVYEANPTIPSPKMLTDMVAGGQRLTTHPMIVNTYVDAWEHLPADVRSFLRYRCQGMLSNPSNLPVPADFPPLAVLQWGKWPLAGCMTGKTTDVDANALSDLWAPPEPVKGHPDMIMVQASGDNAIWLVGVGGRRHVTNSPDGHGGEFDALKKAGIPLVEIDADGLNEIPLAIDHQWLQGQLRDIHEDVAALPEQVVANLPAGTPNGHDIATEVAAELRMTPFQVHFIMSASGQTDTE